MFERNRITGGYVVDRDQGAEPGGAEEVEWVTSACISVHNRAGLSDRPVAELSPTGMGRIIDVNWRFL
jgi:hypothetical protein